MNFRKEAMILTSVMLRRLEVGEVSRFRDEGGHFFVHALEEDAVDQKGCFDVPRVVKVFEL